MCGAAAGLMLGWLVLLGAGGGAQRGIEVKGTGPGGTVVQVDPKGVTGSARVQVQESQQTIRQNVESFLLVQDGGEARLTVVEQVPEIVWFQKYAYRHRHLTAA